MRPPEAPSGWPMAMAPPCLLTIAGSMSQASMQASDWAAKASLSSTAATSSQVMPARASARSLPRRGRSRNLRVERARAPAGDAGNRGEAEPSAAASLPSSTAEAPSLSGEALPAVTVPPSVRNDGAQPGQPLRRRVGPDRLVAGQVDTRHGHDEVVVEAVAPGGVGEAVGAGGEVVLPLARDVVALAQLLGGLAERDGPLRRHRRVDQTPAESRGGQSEIACGIGLLGLGQHPGGAASSTRHRRRRRRRPRRSAIWREAIIAASRLEPQSRLTVVPGIVVGSPASRVAMRATLRLSSPAPLALPKTTSSTCSPAPSPRPGARSTMARTTRAARSSGRVAASAPPKRPNGVRMAS